MKILATKACLLVFIGLLIATSVSAANRTVNFVVAYKNVNFAGKLVRAIAVNNQIPGPTLRFREGDQVRINVYNHLDQGTSIHWHGLLLPWKMDGVSTVTQQPIAPGAVFHYHFKLRQSGTYWYHAHAGLQEQEGLYGAFIIVPKRKRYRPNKDFVIVLSDWINTAPDKVFANLKKEGEFYSSRFPIQSSLFDFIKDYNSATPKGRIKLKHAYYMMQKMRMGLYDISDVAYDGFLLNGQTKMHPWNKRVSVGDTVRLRFIDAGASTLFHIKIPGATMRVIHVEGNDVKPYVANSLTIAPGETYDVLVKIRKRAPYIIYAESADKLGAAYGVLTTQKNQGFSLNLIKPFPKPAPLTMMMPPKTSKETKTKYDVLRAIKKTNTPHKKVHIIKMMLSGFMGRYMWFLSGKPEWKAKPIIIKRGQRYRFVLMNHSIMHHPMHIHGHWFILRNGHGSHDPLLHTIDVPPNATVIADVDAKESGQWYFHCHNLYHMKAGMATILRYKSMKDVPTYLSGHKLGWYAKTHLDLGADFSRDKYEGELNTMVGTDTDKVQLYSDNLELDKGIVDKTDVDLFYWHLVNQFWAVKGGINYTYRPAQTPYIQPGVGIEGLAPFFIGTDLRAYLHRGSVKFDLQFRRETHIYRRLFLNMSVRGIAATKTIKKDMIGNGLNSIEFNIGPHFVVTPNLSLFANYEHTRYFGRLKRLRVNENESATDNTFMIGVSVLI